MIPKGISSRKLTEEFLRFLDVEETARGRRLVSSPTNYVARVTWLDK